jgi:hypothetical protein
MNEEHSQGFSFRHQVNDGCLATTSTTSGDERILRTFSAATVVIIIFLKLKVAANFKRINFFASMAYHAPAHKREVQAKSLDRRWKIFSFFVSTSASLHNFRVLLFKRMKLQKKIKILIK